MVVPNGQVVAAGGETQNKKGQPSARASAALYTPEPHRSRARSGYGKREARSGTSCASTKRLVQGVANAPGQPDPVKRAEPNPRELSSDIGPKATCA